MNFILYNQAKNVKLERGTHCGYPTFMRHRPHQPPIPKRPNAPITPPQSAPLLPPHRENAPTHQEQCIAVLPPVSTPNVTHSSVPPPNMDIPSAQAPFSVAPSQPNRTSDVRTRILSPSESSAEAEIWKWIITSLSMNVDGPLHPTHTVEHLIQDSKRTSAKTKQWLQSVHRNTLADCVQRYATDAETVLKMPSTPFTALEWFQHHLGYSRMRKTKSGGPGVPWLRFVPE